MWDGRHRACPFERLPLRFGAGERRLGRLAAAGRRRSATACPSAAAPLAIPLACLPSHAANPRGGTVADTRIGASCSAPLSAVDCRSAPFSAAAPFGLCSGRRSRGGTHTCGSRPNSLAAFGCARKLHPQPLRRPLALLGAWLRSRSIGIVVPPATASMANPVAQQARVGRREPRRARTRPCPPTPRGRQQSPQSRGRQGIRASEVRAIGAHARARPVTQPHTHKRMHPNTHARARA